jgi:hypothetical protein
MGSDPMGHTPSIKGTVMVELVEDAVKLLDAGELSRHELEARLRPEDLAVLSEPVLPSKWYDIELYRRLSELMRDVAGGGRNEYVRERGFARGQRLIKAGLYQQMEYVGRSEVARAEESQARFKAYGRDLRLFVTLSGSLLNFASWSVVVDPDHEGRYRIEVRDVADFPDVLGWGCEGVIDAMASFHGLAGLWRWERLAPDLIIFRMVRSL